MSWRSKRTTDPSPSRGAASNAARALATDRFAEIPLVLRESARRVVSASLDRTGGEESLADVSQTILALIHALGQPDDPTFDARLRAPMARRLVDEMRATVLDVWSEWSAPPPAEEMLQTLSAFETVRRGLGADGSGHFAGQLSGPDGMSLVVEVAHDLRSPLTSILFLAELLMSSQSGDVNDLQHRQLGLIYSAALGLSELASNVIETARGGDRLAESEPTSFSVSGALEAVLDITRPMAEEKGLVIRINAPSSDQRIGFPIALNRVLLNLTTNAIKFTEEGFVELVARERGGTLVEFSVRDTGRGISSEALETLFAPFRRVVGDDRYAFSGTGLGLSLCRRLVSAMGTELEVETEAGWGTRFSFTADLPVERRPHGSRRVENTVSAETNVDRVRS